MKIVAFLQNQWFKDPEGVKAMFDEHPERRERYIEAFLFMGCLTGKRLQSVFGEELCGAIIWEETSRDIGGYAASKFPADTRHMTAVLEKHQPTVVLAFGRIAGDAIHSMVTNSPIIYGPHPAARQGAIEGLRKMRDELTAITNPHREEPNTK